MDGAHMPILDYDLEHPENEVLNFLEGVPDMIPSSPIPGQSNGASNEIADPATKEASDGFEQYNPEQPGHNGCDATMVEDCIDGLYARDNAMDDEDEMVIDGQFSDDEEQPEKGEKCKSSKKTRDSDDVASIYVGMHKSFANYQKAAASNTQNGIAIEDICAPIRSNKDLPIFKPTKHNDDPPGIPDDMPLCVDRSAKLKDMSKDEIIAEYIRMDDAMKHNWRQAHDDASLIRSLDKAVSVNPYIRARQLVDMDCKLYKPKDPFHNQGLVVRDFAVDDWAGYCECEIKDFSGHPTGKRHYYWSTELIQVADKTKEDDMREENLSQRKEIARLKEALKNAEMSNRTPVAKAPVAGGFNPQKDTTKISDGGTRQLLVNSAGEEANRYNVEKPHRCDKCGDRFGTPGSLSTHKSTKHGGVGGKAKTKNCPKCDKDILASSYWNHKCMKEAREAKKNQK